MKQNASLTPSALLHVLALGFYVLGGELLWIGRRFAAKVTGQPAADISAWRMRQIALRKQRFLLD